MLLLWLSLRHLDQKALHLELQKKKKWETFHKSFNSRTEMRLFSNFTSSTSKQPETTLIGTIELLGVIDKKKRLCQIT